MSTQLSTQPYKGTRDFFPDEMRVRNWMFGRVRQVLNSFGYQEYDGPMLEPLDLYRSKTSEEIVNEQLYHLKDRGDRELAIRPEMTPTLARMVAQKQNELPRPIRWFSIPNLWRYERPQRGRLREHWQVNVDLFGGGEPFAEDLEILQVVAAILKDGFGASENDFVVRLNHRGLTNALFSQVLKLPQDKHAAVGRILDAGSKMERSAFLEALKKEEVSAEHADLLSQALSFGAGSKELEEKLSSLPEYAEIARLKTALADLGLGACFQFDPTLMRGFLYYTGLVLEVFDKHPENNRALFGGGRYDNLVGMFGGKPLPGVGFGMGDVTLRHFLETHKLLPDLKKPNGIFLAHLGEPEQMAAAKFASVLREALQSSEIPVFTALQAQKPRKIFETAEKLGARAVVFVGEKEMQTGKLAMKDLVTGTQAEGSPQELALQFSAWVTHSSAS